MLLQKLMDFRGKLKQVDNELKAVLRWHQLEKEGGGVRPLFENSPAGLHCGSVGAKVGGAPHPKLGRSPGVSPAQKCGCVNWSLFVVGIFALSSSHPSDW